MSAGSECYRRGAGRGGRPAQRVEVEIAIAAATLVPIAQVVSKKLEMVNTKLNLQRSTLQALDFDFLCFSLMMASLICPPPNRIAVRRATRTIAAVGFEPTPTPEED